MFLRGSPAFATCGMRGITEEDPVPEPSVDHRQCGGLALLLGKPSTDLPSTVLERLGGLRGLAQASDLEIRAAARGIGTVRSPTIAAEGYVSLADRGWDA